MRLLGEADLILHVGDFTGQSVLFALRALAPVAAVHGNVDEQRLRDELPDRLVVEAEGARIGLVHDPGPRAARHERLRAWFPDCDVIAYGHTHAPELVRHDGFWVVNPGSPTERRRAPRHTMVVLHEGEPALIELS